MIFIKGLKSAEVVKGNKLKVIYNYDDGVHDGEIEFNVELNKLMIDQIPERNVNTSYDEYIFGYDKFKERFGHSYNPNSNLAFNFTTTEPYIIRAREKPPVDMTIDEIEKKLGYKVKIINKQGK